MTYTDEVIKSLTGNYLKSSKPAIIFEAELSE